MRQLRPTYRHGRDLSIAEPRARRACQSPPGRYNGGMETKEAGKMRRGLRMAKNFLLMLLFLVIPVAGAFHPKIRRRGERDGEEIGNKK
jgi:hypothetical protein